MSRSPRTFDVWEIGDALPQKIFDDILVVANHLLRDECPITEVEDWLFPIDNSVIQLKLWAKTVGVERRLLEKIAQDKNLRFAMWHLLSGILKPLRDIEGLCEEEKIVKSPGIQARISAAIEEYQTSINRLVDSVDLLQNYEANLKNEGFLQKLEPGRKTALSIKEMRDHRISDRGTNDWNSPFDGLDPESILNRPQDEQNYWSNFTTRLSLSGVEGSAITDEDTWSLEEHPKGSAITEEDPWSSEEHLEGSTIADEDALAKDEHHTRPERKSDSLFDFKDFHPPMYKVGSQHAKTVTHDMDKTEIQKEFIGKLDECTREAACGRHFILVDRLQDWLRSPVGGKGTYASRLLHRVAYSNWHKPGLPISSDKFKPGDDCCLLVFSILLKLERGDLIDVFSQKKLVDRLLPIPRHELDAIANDGDHSNLSSAFFELQHLFRPASFDLHDRNIWGEDKVVPIYRKIPIKAGGTAKLWQIDVPEEYVGHALRDISSGSRFNAGSAQDADWRYEFALKSFQGKNHELYKNEMDALIGLQGHEGMIRWLADYEKVDKADATQVKTYNILLEFGEMDLADYFKRTLPPVLPLEIEAFWRSLFAVANAVQGVHDLKVRDDSGQTKEWHADIKPDNILFVEKRLKKKKDDTTKEEEQFQLAQNKSTFKLADPGFAKFVKKSQEESIEVPKQHLSSRTETYSAPEYPGRSEHPVSQAIDIWSLACVFSLAATWIIHDHAGVALFHMVRQRAIKKHIEAQRGQTALHNQITTVSEGDQFHNGREVLDAVAEWHKYLRTVIRKTDTITRRVLDLVDKMMLLGTPEHRIKANELCSQLALMFNMSSREERAQLPETLMTILGEIDEEESIHAAESMRRSRYLAQGDSSSSKTVTHGVHKSTFVERPLKTTHRQSIWLAGKYPEHQGLKIQTVPEQAHYTSDTYPTPQLPTTHRRLPSEGSSQRPPTRSRRSGTAKKYPSQNYFQACEAVKKQENKRKGDIFRGLLKKDDPRDGLLVSYFRDKRDIIFLVDNAESMEAHWYEATKLIKVLFKKARGVDEDGMDLRFTTGNISLNGQSSAHEFVKSMHRARPRTRSKERAHTDLRISLGDIGQEYLYKLKRRPLNVKEVVVIVLTDGIWKGMESPEEVADHIKQFAGQMKASQNLKQRPFSVEFIQFGNDEAATRRLRYLDDCLHELGIPDIIDTEHSTGDVNKMLLGSFVEEYDKDEGDELALLPSSDSNPYGSERTMSPESSHGEGGLGMEYISQSVQRSPTSPTCTRPSPRVNG